MSSQVAERFAKVLSWESFRDAFETEFQTFWLDLINSYAQTDSLIVAFRASIFIALMIWILNLVTGTPSWVDKLWSILPIVYALHFAFHDFLCRSLDLIDRPYCVRLYIVTFLIAIWGARLTFNFYRKDGYTSAGVDYRWTYLQAIIPRFIWHVFDISFICLFQNILLFLLAAPSYVISQIALIERSNLNWIDVIATVGLIACLTLETVADNQQWEFHERKRIAKLSKKTLTGDVKRGFLSHGLFKYSRHPNFFGEMGVWWCVYLYFSRGYVPHKYSVDKSYYRRYTHSDWPFPVVNSLNGILILFKVSCLRTI